MNDLIEFVLEKSENEALEKRAELYDALSRIVGDPVFQKKLEELAAMLKKAHHNCNQLRFEFKESRN